MQQKQFYTTSEIANLLGISRVAVFKKIKSGAIKAVRIGRNYAISNNEFAVLSGGELSDEQKNLITNAVAGTVSEYGETLKLLGRE